MKKFTSSLDQTSIIISWAIIILPLVIFITGYATWRKSGGESVAIFFSTFTTVALVIVVAALYMLHTTEITVNSTSLTIERKIKPLTINFSDIKSVSLVPKKDMGFVMRTFGNGGVFGYTGMYYSKAYGSMTWYSTNRKSYVLIEKTNGKKLVITPDEPESMLREIHAANPGLFVAM